MDALCLREKGKKKKNLYICSCSRGKRPGAHCWVNHLPVASECGGEMTENHIFLGNAPRWGPVWMGGQRDGCPTPLQPLLRLAPPSAPWLLGRWVLLPDVHASTRVGIWDVQPGRFTPWQFPREKGTKPVKTGSWGLSARTALLQPRLPLSGNSFQKDIYIYIKNKNLFYIYISISELSLHGYLSPSIPTGARSLCPAPLVSSRGEAFLSVPSPQGSPQKTPLGPPKIPLGPPPNPLGPPQTLQAPQTLWTLCILMTVSCDVLTSLVYSEFPQTSWF